MRQATAIIGLLSALLGPPRPIAAEGANDQQSVEGLRTAFQRYVAAWSAPDIPTIVAMERTLVEFGRRSVKPRYKRDMSEQELRRYVQQFHAERQCYEWTPTDWDAAVIGSTGLVWGLYTRKDTMADGSRETVQGRFTNTFVFIDWRWRVVLGHRSPMPEPAAP